MHTQFDKLVDQFEIDLKAGKAPKIDEWLDQVPEISRQPILLDLISLEIFYLMQRGETVKVDDYSRYGDVARNHANESIKQSERGWETQDRIPTQTAQSQRIGRYKLLQKIGEGGMGAVWMAEQEEPVKRRVAIKLIKSELASKEVIARFEAERQALAMMDHHNIAKVLDAGTTDGGTPYFVMELVKGIPITKYCDQHKLNVEERLELFIPVCRAIQHAHLKGILHRDLKPSNVLVTHYDGEAVPKVIDFGMAKAVSHNMRLTDKTLFTEFGKVVGTLQYMSPEQAEMDALDVDTRSDIYSLGIMLYELLTGSTPVDQKTISSNQFFQVLEIIREKDPPRPSNLLNSSAVEMITRVSDERKISSAKLRQVLKGDLDWVVMKALDKDRTRRYQTADDFARDITNYLSGEAVIARPPSTLYQVQKFAAKNRSLVASILTVGLVLVAGIIGTTFGMVRANRKTAEAEENRKIAELKTGEAEEARKEAKASELVAIAEKNNALKNEERAIAAEKRTSIESKRARDSEAGAKFQLANARYDANRPLDARMLLHEIPKEYQNTFEWKYCNRLFLGSDITCYGHTGRIFKVAYSPDGKKIASASSDKTIRIWDAASGKEVSTLIGHTDSVGSIAFSPSGKQLASASSDATVKMWDVESGQQIGTVEGHSDLVASVVFSPDGEQLATASDDMTIKLWDSLTYENLKTFEGHTGEVGNVVFSPDGRQLVSSSVDRTVRIWDIKSGKELSTLKGHNEFVISVAWSPDGRKLASASFDTVKLWDSITGEETNTLVGHTQFVHNVAFSPDGARLASSGRDHSIKIWNVNSGVEIMTLKGHGNWVNGVAFSPDGSRLASGSYDKTVKVWDIRTGRHINLLKGHSEEGTKVAFSPDGTKLASSSYDQTVRLWDSDSGQEVMSFNGHKSPIFSLAIDPSGNRIASADFKGLVKLWDIESGQEIETIQNHEGRVLDVVFSPTGGQLASAGQDKTIRVWDVESSHQTASLEGHKAQVQCIGFSHDGSLLASGSRDQTVRVWNTESWEETLVMRGHFGGTVRHVTFSPNGKFLASSGNDRTIRIWDLNSGRQIASMTGHTEPVTSIAFNHDGTRLVSASADKMVKLWDMETNQEVMTLRGHTGLRVNSVAFSPDGNRIAAIGQDNWIEVWNADPDFGVKTFSGHKDRVFQVSFNEDDSQLISRSGTENLVWDIRTGTPIGNVAFETPIESRQFSDDDRWFVTSELNSVLLVDRESHTTQQQQGFLAAKSKYDAQWHATQAHNATAAKNWFAAVFHFSSLMRHDPDYAAWHDGLHAAYANLRQSLKKEEWDFESMLNTSVKESLKLPRGTRLPSISSSQAEAINGTIWGRVSTADAFEKNPLSEMEISVFRDAVAQHPLAIYYNTLGTAEYRKGNFEEAIAAAIKSVEMMPSETGTETPYPGDFAILAMAWFKRGDLEQANRFREKFRVLMERDEYKQDKECVAFQSEVVELFKPPFDVEKRKAKD